MKITTKITANNETEITKKNIARFDDENSTKEADEDENIEKTILFLRLFFKEKSFDEMLYIVFVLRDVRKIDDKEFFRNSIVIR